MPSVCHTSPIEEIIKQGHRIQSDSLIPSKRTRLVPTELTAHYTSKNSHVEKCFLHNASDLGGVDSVRFLNQPSPLTFIGQNNTEDSSNWVPQFSSMRIDDPLEFSSEYKRLYSNYESQQRQNSSRQHFPFPNCMVRKTSCAYPPQKTLRQQRQGNRDNSTNAFKFDAEFQNLEKEIQEVRYEPTINQDEKWLDQDQLELQRIATDIVKCCTPPPSSTFPTSTLSSVESKLSESKFLQLMRDISTGDVTLKKKADGNSASELFSSNNGELVGNRHICVQDEIHENLLD